MKRTSRAAILVVAASATLVAAVTFRLWREPLWLAPEGVVVIFVGSSCPYSQAAFRSASQPLRAGMPTIVPAPVDPEMDAGCAPAQRALIRARALYRFIPASIFCASLLRYSAEFHRQHFTTLPAIAIGSVPVPPEAEREALALIGIAYEKGPLGTMTFRPRAAPDPERRAREITDMMRRGGTVSPIGL